MVRRSGRAGSHGLNCVVAIKTDGGVVTAFPDGGQNDVPKGEEEMMGIDKNRLIIEKRAAIDDERRAGVERCWAELAGALTGDIKATRRIMLQKTVGVG